MTAQHRRASIAAGTLVVALLVLVAPVAVHRNAAAAATTRGWSATVGKVSTTGSEISATVTYTAPRPGARITDADLHFVKGPNGCTLPDDRRDTAPVEPPAPTTTEPPTTTDPRPQTVSQDFSFGPAPSCNGTYSIEITANATSVPPAQGTIDTTLAVAVPAPKVRDLTVVANDDRTVTVSWLPGFDTPAGTQYEVSRVDAVTGDSSPLPSPSTSPTVDSIPDSGGSFAYSVASVRQDETGAYTVRNSVRSSPPVTFQPVAAPTTQAAAPPETSATRAPSGAGGLGATAPPATPPPADFEGDGDAAGPAVFDATEPGEENPVLPESARAVPRYDKPPGAGLLQPVAIALCLAVWAAILLTVTRMARQAERALAVVAIEHDL